MLKVKHPSVPLIVLCLGPGALLQGQEEGLIARDRALIQQLRPTFGLTSHDALKVRRTVPDPLLLGHDTRIDQYYKGVKVLGGEGILHQSGSRLRGVTDAFVKQLDLDTTPDVKPQEALAAALENLAPKGAPRIPPSTELVVARLKGGDALAYHIQVQLENGALETDHVDYLVDAHTGKILKRWSSLRTDHAATGLGHSQYSGDVTLNTTQRVKDQIYELRDWTRGHTGNVVLNLDHSTESDGEVLTDADNVWGDGRNYDGGSTTSDNGETAGVDAAYGLQSTWDYYKSVYGRNGVDDKGTAVSMRIHYGTHYENAFWSDSCGCMTLGDGDSLKSLEPLDVIAHELSHGVCSATADLVYDGESGGLNESNSDINAVLTMFHTWGGGGSVIGSFGGRWTIGDDLASADHPGPLRYLYKPSKDGGSPDAWSEDLKYRDVHESSGPMNRCFFFLSQGSSASERSDFYTCLLPLGMDGVGNDKAGQIWYRALTHYLTSTSGYQEARKACIQAAKDLYGPSGPEETAVWNAFHGINVGPAWGKE